MIDKHGSDSALASPSSGVSHRAAGPSPRIGAFIVAGALAMLDQLCDQWQLGAGGPELQFDLDPLPAIYVKATRLGVAGPVGATVQGMAETRVSGTAASQGAPSGASANSASPAPNAIGKATVGLGGAHIVSEVSRWIHAGILLFFLNYLPYSKHIHILGALPNIYFRNLDQRGVMPKVNLDDEKDWGVGQIDQFSHKALLDQYACTECARCSNYCPAYNTDKPLSPMHLIHDLKDEMKARGDLGMQLDALKKQAGVSATDKTEADAQLEKAPDDIKKQIAELQAKLDEMPPLVGGRIKDETLWSCTTCGACQEVCPVFIDHPLKIQQMKTHLVLTEGRMPTELQRTFQNLERNGNPNARNSPRLKPKPSFARTWLLSL